MLDRDGCLVRISTQRIGVVAERAKSDLVVGEYAVYAGCICRRKVGHVDVRHASIAAVCFSNRPAHCLDALEALGGCECDNLFEAQIMKNSADEAELHLSVVTSFADPGSKTLLSL